MALIIALALMTGLQGELRDRIVGIGGARLRLQGRAGIDDPAAKITKLRQIPRVIGAAPASSARL